MKTNSFRKMLLLVLFCVLIIPTIGTATAKYSNQIQLNEISLNIIGDSTPPAITLSVPDKTDSITYTVTGTVSDDSGVASVKVNGVDATITGNTWFADITLTDLAVTAVATDTAGNETTESITYQEFTVTKENRGKMDSVIDMAEEMGGVNVYPLTVRATFLDTEKNIYYKVTAIGENAFSDNHFLDTVTISDSVVTIGESAFASSTISEVSISNSVTTIAESAFADNGFTSITVPDNVTYIGANAFSGCTILTNITFEHTDDDTITIGSNAFYVGDYLETTITTTNDYILNTYDWVADNRAKAPDTTGPVLTITKIHLPEPDAKAKLTTVLRRFSRLDIHPFLWQQLGNLAPAASINTADLRFRPTVKRIDISFIDKYRQTL